METARGGGGGGTDAESLQERRSSGGARDVFLVASVTFLFLALAAVTVVGTREVLELRSKVMDLDTSLPNPAARAAGADSSVYKMQNFAYLRASDSRLTNSTVGWREVRHGARSSVGSLYHYDATQKALQATRAGVYFLYVDLNLTCTARCREGAVAVAVGDRLTCRVALPERADSTPVTRKCWTVAEMEADSRLVAEMTAVLAPGEGGWKLELKGSGVGLFLVD